MSHYESWDGAWRSLQVEPPADLLRELEERYAEPHRAYHTLAHVEECFRHFEPARELAERPAEVMLGLWFHDAIYDTQQPENEERSAEWTCRALVERGAPQAGERVRALILATKHDAQPTGSDAQLLVDIDLAILGAAPERFDEYERQVQVEYSWVPEEAFRKARVGILEQFLARPAIYSTDAFASRLESSARANLTRSLARLASGD